MSAAVAHSFKSVTSVPRLGVSATARYGLDEPEADHVLCGIWNLSRSDEKTQAINRDSFAKAARMLLEHTRPSSYHLARFLAHDYVYRQVAYQVGTRLWEHLPGVFRDPYAVPFNELRSLANAAGFSTVMPESQGHFTTFVGTWEFTWQLPSLSRQGPYAARLSELEALANEEGISPVSPESEQDFLSFVSNSLGFPVRRASLSLLDGGALGAVWRDEQWRLSLRFHGDGLVGYVLLDRTNPPAGSTGKCELNNFSIDCKSLDLTALLTR